MRFAVDISFIRIAAGLTLLASCNYFPSTPAGGGSSGSGSVSLAMSDAPSDEIESFVVDATALALSRSDGAIVSVLSSPVTVDLASLSDTTQLLNAASVPAGDYTSATITLDFTSAVCVLAGQSSPAAIVDDSGAAVSGTQSFSIHFDQSALTVAAHTQRLLEFDFDLDQSCVVDATANSVVLEPAIDVRVGGSGKQLVAFATLVSADANAHVFVGSLHTPQGAALGNATFTADASTIYQIDGVPAVGPSGLTALASKAAGTWMQVYGAIDPVSASLLVHYVEAGSGTLNGGTDIVEGHVLDRVGNPPPGNNTTFVVRGRSTNSTHTFSQYDTTFNVTTNFAETKVVRIGSAQALDTDDLNVGQRVRVFGTLSGTAMNATMPTSVIREQRSRAYGLATGAINSGTLTLALQHIDLRPSSAFAWTDSGSTPPDPTLFTVNAGTLGDALGIASGTPVEARGFLAPIADSNQDFDATALIDLATAPSFLFVKDLPSGMTVAVTASATQIQLTMTGTPSPGEHAVVDHGFAGVQPLPASPAPTIQPASGAGPFTLRDKATGSVVVYVAFDAFATALASALAQGATLRTLGAVGDYDAATNTLLAAHVSVVVQ